MKFKFLILFISVSGGAAIMAQTTPVGPSKYWIQFNDRAQSPYSITQPEQFLSPKALERRVKQSIDISENDLPVNPNYVSEIAQPGVKILNQSKWFNAITIQVDDTNLLASIRALASVKNVNKVARIKVKSTADQLMEDLTRLMEQAKVAQSKQKSGLPGSGIGYGTADLQIAMINGKPLHELGYRGQGMVIAVLDGGFYHVDEIAFFDSLRNAGRILGTRDFVVGDNAVYEDNSHGLMVLSTMAANIPGSFVGTAPLASYWLLRTEDVDSEFLIEEDNWVRGAEFADSVGADVINSSLGYTKFDDPATSHTYEELNGKTTRITIGASIAASKGILVVNSAGNSGDDPWHFIGVPADADSVLSIGAVKPSRAYASFSSVGPTSDNRIKPNVAALGQESKVILSSGDPGTANGTSFSSPIIAGMSACLMQAHPKASAMQVFKAIEQSADQFENPDEKKGFGIPDYLKAHQILALSELKGSVQDSIVNVYPNPFIEGLTIEFYSTSTQEINIEIHKMSGKRVASEKLTVYPLVNNMIQLDHVRKLSAGLYTVTIEASGKAFTRKVLKN
jgi:serine protease AprX